MSVHQRVTNKNFNRILKIKSVVSFLKDILFRKLNFDPGSVGLLLKSKRMFSLCRHLAVVEVVEIESVQHLP